jgi:hypothetical protein
VVLITSNNEKICIAYAPITAQVAPVIPPFTYNYMCSSVVLTAYIPVYLYIYCLQIVLTLGIRLIVPLYTKYSSLPLWFQPLCPGVMFPEHWQTRVSSSRVVSNPQHRDEEAEKAQQTLHQSMAIVAEEPADVSESSHVATPNKLLRMQNVVVPIFHHITILLSFGLCCPLLAAAIGCTLYLSLEQWRLHIGRFLHTRQQILQCEITSASAALVCVDTSSVPSKFSPDHTLSCLEAAVTESTVYFLMCIWPVVWFSCLFFAFLCWDMAGDEVGWKRALWVPVVAICVPLLLYGCKWVYGRYVDDFLADLERAGRTISNTRGLVMSGANCE